MLKLRLFRYSFLLLLIVSLTGCLYWIRAYQTYLQLNQFDQYFTIEDAKVFAVHFKEPILYNRDLVSLAKLQPSYMENTKNGSHWRYTFRKVDAQQTIVQPELAFFFDFDFNQEDRVTTWTFSPLFLQIAPPKFLEVSLRSLAGGELNTKHRQLRANAKAITKIDTLLPQKAPVVAQLGKPLEIKDAGENEVYIYHFLLETHAVEKGYEDRPLSVVNLTFDKKTQELVQMGGRFAGLKLSIHYSDFVD